MGQVTLYSSPACEFCKKARDWLLQHNISFSEIDVLASETDAAEMVRETGQEGIPVIRLQEDSAVRFIIGYRKKELEEEFGR